MYWAAKLRRAIGLGPETTLRGTFAGNSGYARIADTLSTNPAVNGDQTIVSRLMGVGETVFFQRGDRIIRRGEQDNVVLFLLSGEVDVVFKSGNRTRREAPNQVGEMAAIELGKKRSATVIARSGEVAALRVSATDFNRIRAASVRFQDLLQVEMSARHRERIVAGEIARQNTSLVWLCMSLGVALIGAVISWFSLGPLEWTSSARLLVSGGVGLLTFVFTLLHNPAFFWRRVFAITLLAMLGTYAMDLYVSVEAKQGIGSLVFEINSGESVSDPVQEISKAVPYLAVLLVCACMDRFRNRD